MTFIDLNIRALRVRTVIVPMPTPHLTAGGRIDSSPLVLTDVVTNEGVVGQSMVFTYTPLALQPVATLVRNLGELIQGKPVRPQEIERTLQQKFRLLGPQGLNSIAMAAIDMALWDALAMAADCSLAELLGAAPRFLPVYGGIGYDGVDGSARSASAWAEKGFKAVKAKIGYPSVKEDIAVVRAIRQATGNAVDVMVDYNQSLSVGEALLRCRVLDEEGLLWIEEPTRAHDHRGHASISREIRTPIQAGENWWGPHELVDAIDACAVDNVMPDVMKIGGVSGWMRSAAIADAHGLRVSNHLFPEISAQLLTATPTAYMLEYADWWNPVLEQPLTVSDGVLDIRGVKGTGVRWNERMVEKYIV